VEKALRVFDFSGKRVLVVGGSSGIGNGIAQSFRRCGADVWVWGTRASANDYSRAEGSDLTGLSYSCLDVADAKNIESYVAPFAELDVLVQSQGTVMYAQREFEMSSFQRVMDINLNSVMACAVKFRLLLARSHGSIVNVSSVAAYRATMANPAYSAS
jgi:3-oxoacyl-[acyl-carrier protein] reductase